MAGKGHVHTDVMAKWESPHPPRPLATGFASDNSGNVDNLLSMMCNAATDSVATRQQQC